jgi:hypothetical protein
LLLSEAKAKATILDLHGEPTADWVALDPYDRVRRRERGGILDQLGQQVNDVRDGMPARAVPGRTCTRTLV